MVVRTNDPMGFSVKSQKGLEFHFRDKWSGQLVSDLASVDNKSPAVCIFINPLDEGSGEQANQI